MMVPSMKGGFAKRLRYWAIPHLGQIAGSVLTLLQHDNIMYEYRGGLARSKASCVQYVPLPRIDWMFQRPGAVCMRQAIQEVW